MNPVDCIALVDMMPEYSLSLTGKYDFNTRKIGARYRGKMLQIRY